MRCGGGGVERRSKEGENDLTLNCLALSVLAVYGDGDTLPLVW